MQRSGQFWIGLQRKKSYDPFGNQRWTWTDKTPVKYVDFGLKEKFIGGPYRGCVIFTKNNRQVNWEHRSCSEQ
jgi:hypothetical protein